ncbi:MAG: ThiF family adenylyltransferase [Armatimonadetes bacterium]|nr:ThiF family adenylyltransferase [Armatimonadota bacterium]
MTESLVLEKGEERFSRFALIGWWDQELLKRARVLVVGAGALGNELLKNLALLGVGHVVVADMDRIEKSNLSRSVLFREADEGRFKAEVAAEAARSIYPDLRIRPVVGNVMAELGLGYFAWADVVVGCLDNREARVFVNTACAKTGKAWFDAGIEAMNGVVRGFEPPGTACYECTMGQRDWDEIARRRSCSLLARQAQQQGATPTTPTTASVLGALQAQELVKYLHRMDPEDVLLGKGFFFEGRRHTSYPITYSVHPDCPWHEGAPGIERVLEFSSRTPLREVWSYAQEKLGGLDALDLSRELVERLECGSCGIAREVFVSVEKISAEQAVCSSCGQECGPSFFHSLCGGPHLDRTAAELGLPGWDVIWARKEDEYLGIELAGDRPGDLS